MSCICIQSFLLKRCPSQNLYQQHTWSNLSPKSKKIFSIKRLKPGFSFFFFLHYDNIRGKLSTFSSLLLNWTKIKRGQVNVNTK